MRKRHISVPVPPPPPKRKDFTQVTNEEVAEYCTLSQGEEPNAGNTNMGGVVEVPGAQSEQLLTPASPQQLRIEAICAISGKRTNC